MIDTVNFTLTRDEVEGVNFLEEIPLYLNPDNISFHKYRGVECIAGKIGNFNVRLNQWQIWVKNGSLAKWYNGNNYEPLTPTDIKQAIEKLSDALHLPMDKAKITRLDVGFAMETEKNPFEYLPYLGFLDYAKRTFFENETLYYKFKKGIRLSFYDKNREQKDNIKSIPQQYQDKNLLRYELRYLHRLPRLLNVPEVRGRELYNPTFISRIVDQWESYYNNIRKEQEIKIDDDMYLDSIKDFQKWGILFLTIDRGGENAMIERINLRRKTGRSTAKQALDLRNTVKKVFEEIGHFKPVASYIIELNRKVNETATQYKDRL